MLNLLKDVYEAVLDQSNVGSEHLHRLQTRVQDVSSVQQSTAMGPSAAMDSFIWQMAMQIYLARASQLSDTPDVDLDGMVDDALSGPILGCACPHFFPLFIVGCEARTDSRREAILNLIDRAENSGIVRSKAWLKDVILSVWVHMDLYADEDLLVDYVGTIGTVISASGAIPSFA